MKRKSALSIFGALAVGGSLTQPALSQGDDVVDTLTKLNATLQLATKNYDVATIEKLITDDYELVSSSGKVYDRAAFLADAADRSAVYELNEPEDVKVRHYNNDCAIVTAILHVRFTSGQKTVDVRIRYGDVWVKLDGQWRYAYGEASPLKQG
jgi:hypothetical protein